MWVEKKWEEGGSEESGGGVSSELVVQNDIVAWIILICLKSITYNVIQKFIIIWYSIIYNYTRNKVITNYKLWIKNYELRSNYKDKSIAKL